jgi:predicted transcriptional regulator
MATIIEMAAEILTAHASSSPMTGDELIAELHKIHAALQALETAQTNTASGEEAKPTLTIKDAFKKNEVICMICGKGGMKVLTRHLSTVHNLKPREYKKQFGIPRTQSLSAKSLTESRRKTAQEKGLADNLVKAREAKAANFAKKAKPAKAPKSPSSAKAVVTPKATKPK